ncbi:MAG TPA: hypothetical protein DD740_01955 [Chryseobacterium sp.]|nr:hypothetical protein [Chryseobacterium sp.]
MRNKDLLNKKIQEKFTEAFVHTVPKALFIYLPIFAFILWLFHDKKKWWYFDHGIFTLHYFSFLLLNILIFSFLNKLTNVVTIGAINWLLYLVMTGMIIYSALYFFVAHRRVYRSHGIVSLIIGFILFAINFIAFLFLVVGLGLISFLMIH